MKWHNEKRKIKDLIPYEHNPRILTDKQYKNLKASLKKFGLAEIPAINHDNVIAAGHQRLKILEELHGPEYEIDVRVPEKLLTKKQFEEYLIRSNKNTGEWDNDILANNFETSELAEWGFSDLYNDDDGEPGLPGDGDPSVNEYRIEVDLLNQEDQDKLHAELKKRGFDCKKVIL